MKLFLTTILILFSLNFPLISNADNDENFKYADNMLNQINSLKEKDNSNYYIFLEWIETYDDQIIKNGFRIQEWSYNVKVKNKKTDKIEVWYNWVLDIKYFSQWNYQIIESSSNVEIVNWVWITSLIMKSPHTGSDSDWTLEDWILLMVTWEDVFWGIIFQLAEGFIIDEIPINDLLSNVKKKKDSLDEIISIEKNKINSLDEIVNIKKNNNDFFTPEVLKKISKPQDFNTSPKVIWQNILLSILFIILVNTSSALLNATIEKRRSSIKTFYNKIPILNKLFFNEIWLISFYKKHSFLNKFNILLAIVIYWIIISFIEIPSIIFWKNHLILIILFIFSTWIISIIPQLIFTYFLKWKVNNSLIVYPFWLILVMLCVLLWLWLNMSPIFLFWMPLILLTIKKQLNHFSLNEGKIWLYSILSLLLIWITFWLSLLFFDWEIITTISLISFILSIEMVIFELMPICPLSWKEIFNYSKIKWLMAMIIAYFLFFHTIVNPNWNLFNLLNWENLLITIIIFWIFSFLSFCIWFLFWKEKPVL